MNLKPWQQKGNYFSYKGNDIFYIEEGKGETLVLLHGFPTCSIDWYKIWEDLTSKFHVICFDFIGFGFSDKPTNYDYSIEDQTNLTVELLEHLNVKAFHILSHDYGDSIAQELLHRFNNHLFDFEIKSCCLLNGGLFPGVYKPRLVQRLLLKPVIGELLATFYTKSKFKKVFYEIFGPNTPPTNEEIDVLWELMNYKNGRKNVVKINRYQFERKRNQEKWLKALQEAKCPLRFMNGLADPISGANMMAHYKKVIPNPDVVALENAGHYPQIEAPEEVLEHFLMFA